jgi:hypothetical protein
VSKRGDRAWIYFRPQTTYEEIMSLRTRYFIAYIRAIADGIEIVAVGRLAKTLADLA